MALKREQTVPRSLRTLFHGGTFTGLTDGQLLERFAVREVKTAEAAFAALVERHGPMVLRTCLAVLRDEHEAHDAFQATFLVLVNKAGTLWVEDSLGPWLHRVAYRAAARARLAAARRRVVEQRAAERVPERTEAHTWDDLTAVIHDEIDRLPERYRIPVVLCDLEERPYEEAARHLGCPVGTIKSRLARGRERLKQGLTRRGLDDRAGILASGFVVAGASAALPASLTSSTIRLAIGSAAARPALVSIAILVKEALRAMIKRRLGSSVSALFVLGVVAIGPSVLMPKRAEPPVVAAPANDEPNAEPLGDLETIQGTWVRVYTSVGNVGKEQKSVRMVVTKDAVQPQGGISAGAASFVFEWRTEGDGGSGQKVILDPTQAPKTIDFLSNQSAAPKVLPGIYRVEGDTLTICFKPIRGEPPAGIRRGQEGGDPRCLSARDIGRISLVQTGAPTAATAGPAAAGRTASHDASIDGNWIVRGAYGNALALLNIEVQDRQPRVSMLPGSDLKSYRLPESRIENARIDENSVRFNLRLVSDRNPSGTHFVIDAYLPESEAQPKILLGSMALLRRDSRSSWSGPP